VAHQIHRRPIAILKKYFAAKWLKIHLITTIGIVENVVTEAIPGLQIMFMRLEPESHSLLVCIVAINP
jgi:hypothetical protein